MIETRAVGGCAETRGWKLVRLLVIGAVASGGSVFGSATAAATGDDASADCLWAGAAHGQGNSIAAGGWSFRCGTDERGAPYWLRGAAVSEPSTVPNPGAAQNPAGRFSAGARQPGTAYNDYCAGSQLVEGAEDVYQVVTHRDGTMSWKAAAPIEQWRFDPGATGPAKSWRSASLCDDGNLT
ncbi:hypothetical protein ACFZC5_32130 [Nocardia gamkensis]|uniref:hypothetical protein n=1 Tax=Nocardia gamkensis TaxID=352869 RepID=UPI0036E8ABA1